MPLFETDNRKLNETYRDMGWELIQILNEPGDIKELIHRIITLLKLRTGFDAVGIRLQDGNDYPYFSQQGFPDDFLKTENTLIKCSGEGGMCRDKNENITLDCLCGLVISGRTNPADPHFTRYGSCWTNNSLNLADIITSDGPRVNTRNKCIHNGYRSIALVPLRNKESIVGVIQLNDRRKGCFTPAAIEIVEGIASHIGAAMVRIQGEYELRKIKALYQSVIEEQTEIICRYNPDGTYIFVNDAFCRFFGKPKTTLLGKKWFPESHPDDNEMILQKIKTLSPENTVISIENRVYSATGNLRWMQFINRGFYDVHGKLLEIQAIGRDITDLKNIEDFLAQIRQNHETFFNTMDDFLFVLDEKGKILHTNTKVNDRLGYSQKELLGNSILMLYPPESCAEGNQFNIKIFNKIAESIYAPIITKSGVRIPVETSVKEGIWDIKPVIFLVVKDISGIKLSEEKFSKAFHINPSACGLSNLDDHRYTEVNDAFYSLLGYDKDKDDVLGKTVLELGIMTDATRKAILLKADQEGKISNLETDVIAKNGDIKHVILSAEIIKIQGKNYRFTAVYDITKRKQAEKALSESETTLNKAQQVAHVGSWELDDKTHELRWSDETFRIFGYEPGEVSPTLDLFLQSKHPKDRYFIQDAIKTAWGLRTPFSADHRIILPDGRERTVHEQVEILYDYTGKPEKWMGTIQDITERKKAEDELKSTIEQMHHLTQYIEKVRENERVAISRELHDDLGQALTAVMIELEAIRQNVNEIEVIAKIHKVSELVSETINTVQNLTSQLRPPIIDDLGIEAAIEWYANEFAQRTGIDVILKTNSTTSLSPDASLHIFRIMQESLTNIARHSGASQVYIRLSKKGKYVILRISDNGTGINEKEIKSNKSFGIISMKERAASQGGTFDIYNKCGTVIELTLPINNTKKI